MGHSLLKWRSVAIVAAIAALVFVIACGSEEPEPAPVLDVAEIQKSVEAAIASQPAGLTRADVESIVSQSTEGQLSAADVKEIVDQSVRALPAPEIDVSQLSSLVNSAVADAAPEGVSADEISRIVEAQVSAGLSDTLTRGDIEDLVAQAVEDAVGDQLTADQVTDIVNASLVATNQAIEAAASAGRETPTPSGPPVQVVTSANFVGDWVKMVGGDRVEVFSLLQPGGDPHSFVPGAGDVAKVADADVVFTVGLGLEAEWLHDLIHNASADESRVVALGESVDPMEFSGPDPHGHGAHDAHDEDEGDHHGEMVMGRLLIGDGEEGKASVIDLETGEVSQNRFDLGSRAGRIYSTKSGRYAVAVSSDADTAHLFDGGIYMEPHGDHFDLVEGDIRKLPLDLSGDRPVHLYVGSEWATIFYDGSGDVVFINEHELEEQGDGYVPVRMNLGPQHGAAVPLEGDLFATTIKHPDYPDNPDARLPIGAEIRDLDGNVLHRAEGCDSLHGDAGNGHMAVFGCAGGVLVLEAHDGEYSDAFIAPDEAADDFRLTSVWGYPGLDHFFALGSAVGLYIVEPEHEEMDLLIPATEDLRPIQVHLGPGGESLFVVMSDGELRVYDAHDGELQASNDDFLTSPVETGFWARPHLATAPGAIFITDSVGGEVLQLDEHDLEVVGHWDVAGAPTKIAFLGIVGDPEDDHEGHDDHAMHDEHDDHDEHDHGPLDPHFWFDPIRVKIAVDEIAARLSALDPESASLYYQNASDYGEQLDELHSWTQEHVAAVPPERRLLVTSHDSLSYFAAAYGFEVVGLVIPSLATHVEPSAEHIAELIEVVREHGVPAVFGETTVSERLAQAVAREAGAELVQLYSGSMGEPGSSGGTYIGMVRTNVERIVAALK